MLKFLLITGVVIVSIIKTRIKNKKIQKKNEENRCPNGEHKWIQINTMNKSFHACEECRWCPKYEIFVKPSYITTEKSSIEYNEGFEQYKKHVIEQTAKDEGVNAEAIQRIYDTVITINKDFAVKFMEKKIEEEKKHYTNKSRF